MIFSSIVALISFAGALPSTIIPNDEHNAIPKKLKTGAQAAPSIEDQVRLWERATGTKFERKLGNLPLSYTKPDLLADYHFERFGLSSYADGLNKIQRTLYGNYSVSEKYANAFGLNVREFQDKISKKYGVDAHSNRKVCSADSQCDQEKCGIRNGQKTGYCIPTCFGVCHSQAPLKALELAPRLCPTWRYATLLKLHKMSEKIFLTLRDTLAHNKTVASSIGRAPDDTTCFRRDSLL